MKKRKINLHLLDGAEAGSAEGNAQVAESGKAETDDRSPPERERSRALKT